jgi:hypothetical protein
MRRPSQRQHPRATAGNGSAENGAATATASLLVALIEPILEEYAEEARFLSKVKDEVDFEGRRILDASSETYVIVSLQVRSFRCRAVLGRPYPSVSQRRYLQTRRTEASGRISFYCRASSRI